VKSRLSPGSKKPKIKTRARSRMVQDPRPLTYGPAKPAAPKRGARAPGRSGRAPLSILFRSCREKRPARCTCVSCLRNPPPR
jgi:hypothetical protein